MHFKSRAISGFFIYVSNEEYSLHKFFIMKNYLFVKILVGFCCIISLIGCNAENVVNKPAVTFASTHQSEWDKIGKNFYMIQLSMRKIDSLSAALNLPFTKKYSIGL